MREIVFLNKYKEKWDTLDKNLSGGSQISADELSDLFIQLTDDLSYARTFYPESKITQYLNELSIRVHKEIYRNKKEKRSRFVSFWKTEVPLVLAKHQKNILVAFITFAVTFGLGWLSSSRDASYVNLVLGDGYVNQTISNIEDGKPMGIYGSMEEVGMFAYIAENNIRVSFIYFIFGFFFSVGSLFYLGREGLRLGAFFHMFYEHNVLDDAMTAVWIHGTVEISIIIVACGAGVTLGNSIVFPGTYKRSVSLMNGMKDGIKIVLSLVPFFIIAAFLESFVTRNYHASVFVSLSIIFASLALILWYFVFNPIAVRNALNTENILNDHRKKN